MYTIDDPMLALILRFVGRSQTITFQDDEFLRQQLAAIRQDVEGLPPEDRQARALEWIEQHAREYRDRWAQAVVGQMFSGERCADCPLAEVDLGDNCEIHDDWLELLRHYVADEISARTYAEDSLALLARHKENLRLSTAPAREGA